MAEEEGNRGMVPHLDQAARKGVHVLPRAQNAVHQDSGGGRPLGGSHLAPAHQRPLHHLVPLRIKV